MSFSVILNRWDTTKVSAHMSMACLGAIRKFTDEPYEIIVVNNTSDHGIRDEYHVLQPFKEITIPLTNVYDSYNIGAKHATTDKLMFIQNDVYVHERTLNKLAVYLEKWDVAFPQQIPISRKDVKSIHKIKNGFPAHIGQRDAGLLAITREAFEKSGGWDDRYKNLLGEAGFYHRLDQAGLSWTDHTNAFITHIMAASNLSKDSELYNREMEHDSEILNAR
jgi:GT2 family glycosyltransferase